MPCGCGKKRAGGSVHFMGKDGSQISDADEWGPILWKYLHCLAEKICTSGNKITDADQANHMEVLLNTLHLIIPCTECQSHAAQYIASNPIPPLKSLSSSEVHNATRHWLFTFHNVVRTRKGQEIIVHNLDEVSATYAGCFVPNCEYTHFVQSVAVAVRQGWVRIDNWRKWYSHSERMRILVGNIVV